MKIYSQTVYYNRKGVLRRPKCKKFFRLFELGRLKYTWVKHMRDFFVVAPYADSSDETHVRTYYDDRRIYEMASIPRNLLDVFKSSKVVPIKPELPNSSPNWSTFLAGRKWFRVWIIFEIWSKIKRYKLLGDSYARVIEHRLALWEFPSWII